MGVNNCLAHLALHDQRLRDIDPHSPDLTKTEIAMIVDECVANPWYALREVIRIPPIAGVESLPLRANRGNLALYWLFFNHITMLLIQPRQTGKSISVDSLMVVLGSISTINTDISLLTKDDNLRVKNVKRVKGIMDLLPPYFRLRSKKDTNNTEKITIERLGNVYNTAVAQASKKAALNLGRGMSNAINDIDEISFINNIETTLPALLASAGAARDEAKLVGAPYGNLFTTTPGYLGSDSGKYAHSIYLESFRWTELMMDCANEEDLCSKIKLNAPGGLLQVVLDYNHRQLGYTDEWLRGKISESKAVGKAAEADFLNIWPDSNSSGLIPEDKIKVMRDSIVKDGIRVISTYGYIVNWYIPLESISSRTIVAGLDTSEAIGKDGISLVLRDTSTGDVLACGTFNETNTLTFARWLAEFLIEYTNVTMLVERKNTGVSIMDAMIEILVSRGVDPFARLVNFVVQDYRIKSNYYEDVISVPFSRRDPKVYITYRKQFGYVTTGSGRTSRDTLYGEIFNASVKYTSTSIKDPTLAEQLFGLVVRNGRIDHGVGSNDDSVIAWLLAYWFLVKGANFEFYGIASNKVLSTVTETKIIEAGGQGAIDANNYQLQLKEEIDELVSKIRNEKSVLKNKMLVAKLKYLYRDIDTSNIQTLNLASVLEEIELEKKHTAVSRRVYTNYSF